MTRLPRRRGSIALLPVVVVFLSVAAFLAVMYYALPAQKKVAVNTNVAVNENSNTNIVVETKTNTNSLGNSNISVNVDSNPYAGWKIFTSDLLGFSFRYPPTWKIDEEQSNAANTYFILPTVKGVPKGGEVLVASMSMDLAEWPSILEEQLTQTLLSHETLTIGRQPAASATYENNRTFYAVTNNGLFWQIDFSTDKNTAKKVLTSFTFLKTNKSWKVYVSTNLWLVFQYDPTALVTEKGDTIYVGGSATKPEEGQYVQKFSKEYGDSLSEAIQKKFLSSYPSSDCFVKKADYNKPQNWEFATIAFPKTNDNVNPWWQNAEKCPPKYTTTNGLSYFAMDPKFPSLFYYFSIGQYAIPGTSEKTPWQDTVQTIK